MGREFNHSGLYHTPGHAKNTNLQNLLMSEIKSNPQLQTLNPKSKSLKGPKQVRPRVWGMDIHDPKGPRTHIIGKGMKGGYRGIHKDIWGLYKVYRTQIIGVLGPKSLIFMVFGSYIPLYSPHISLYIPL